jgi:hypothetical protein
VRTVRDCGLLAAMVSELTEAELALCFGLLCGAYRQRPQALFWDVLQGLSEKRVTARLIKVV